MAHLWVLFDVPEHTHEAIESGLLKRRGGVVQHLDGRVAMWLRETGRWAGGLESLATAGDSPALASQLGALQLTSTLTLGLQVLNLGVTVAGFAILGARLEKMAAEVDEMLRQSRDPRRAWADARRNAQVLARAVAAIEQADWAERTSRLEELARVRGVLREAEAHYQLLLDAMLDQQRAYRYAPLFTRYFALGTIAGVSRVRADGLLDGVEAARAALSEVDRRQRDLARAYLEGLRDPRANPRVLTLSPDERNQVKEGWQVLTEMLDRLYSYGTELDFCQREGIGLEEWASIGTEEAPGDAVLVFLGPAA